jgi:hypothetical protein
MRLPRMTTRRWMIAVALAAELMSAGIWCGRRARAYRERAMHYVVLAFHHDLEARNSPGRAQEGHSPKTAVKARSDSAAFEPRAEYYARLGVGPK